jgi:hypothetical protein
MNSFRNSLSSVMKTDGDHWVDLPSEKSRTYSLDMQMLDKEKEENSYRNTNHNIFINIQHNQSPPKPQKKVKYLHKPCF